VAKKFVSIVLASKIELKLSRNNGAHANFIDEITAGTVILTVNMATMPSDKQQAECRAKQ
jgi:hypothetical protein